LRTLRELLSYRPGLGLADQQAAHATRARGKLCREPRDDAGWQHAVVGGFPGAVVMLDLGDLASDENSAVLNGHCLGPELLVGQSLHFVDQPLVGRSSIGDRTQ
jgi:hypothetical protein